MAVESLITLLDTDPDFQSLLDGVKRGYSEQMIYGVSTSLKSLVIAGLRQRTGKPCFVVTSTIGQAVRTREDLITWLPGQEVVLFPPMEYMPFEVVAHSPEVVGQRLYVLERLAQGDDLVVVAPAAAFFRALTPHTVFKQALMTLKVQQSMERDDLVARLIRHGYERVEMVESKGHVAVRGEIIDLFPLASDTPLRIAFWGDSIDEIRTFDPGSQRTLAKLDQVTVGPAREFILPVGDLSEATDKIRRDLEQTIGRLTKLRERQDDSADNQAESLLRSASASATATAQGQSRTAAAARARGRKKLPAVLFDPGNAATKLQERVEGHLAKLEQSIYFEGLEQYASFFYDHLETLIDYTSAPALVLVDEPARIRDTSSESELRDAERQVLMVEKGGLLPGQLGLYLTYNDLFQRFRQGSTIHFSALGRGVPGIRPQNEVGISATAMQEFHGQWPLFLEELHRWKKQNYRVAVLTANTDRRDRLREVMLDADLQSISGGELIPAPRPGQTWIGVGSLEGGFQWPGMRLVVVTDGEIYGRPKKRRRAVLAGLEGSTAREAVRVASYQDLKVGDYVVHVNHGIGKYMGVHSETILGSVRDYLVIRYDGTDRLKIPTEQIDQVQKYIGAEGHEPRLNKLGGSEWARVKSRVKESIQEMAAELLRQAAMREAQPGYPFPEDTIWQKGFEETFQFEETLDQLKAVQEIKADMEQPRAMDRLLLGDVGYGKTEVALRAAFKAASDGKQVAILVPTTILAQQHYATCKSRIEGFPINVAVLNRFKSPKEQAVILKGLREGSIEVVIGTHRLLGEDVQFKDLGLLVVDEEQRFGVQHKERIKQMRAAVDVLTLSATPIPRTLHMAMVGMRDMSVITSPPEERYPVETFVAEYDEELIRDAIGRELSRGGQTFVVHNRVQSIEKLADRISQLVPEARVVVVHGQMKEEKLEQILLDFLEGEYDVMVATTIIENGVDIPRVNTILVDDADKLGLSQLYQLRGRVGRSNRLAYAYFLYKREKVISEIAEKRLRAIKDFTELGSGFKIAMRDLEIRGAGNILGPEQHGFIITVGFDLYTQLLEEAVQELKGTPQPVKEIQASVELQVDAFISDQFIADARQKIDAYKRIIAIQSLADAADVAEELVDRFGSLPDAVKNLLDVARLKRLCLFTGVLSLSQIKEQVTVKLSPSAAERISTDRLVLLNRRPEFKGRIVTKGAKAGQFGVKVSGLDQRSILRLLQELIGNLQELSSAAVR